MLRSLLKTTGTAGNPVSDSHLAALAIEHGYTVYSTDHDFQRFNGVEHVNPLGAEAASPRRYRLARKLSTIARSASLNCSYPSRANRASAVCRRTAASMVAAEPS